MKRIHNTLAALLLAFLLTGPVFAQEATQAVEPSPTAEAVTTEIVPPSEPVTDVHNALDDLIEFFTMLLSNPTMYLGLGLIFAVVKIKQPQTRAEYEAERQEIAKQREAAKKTDEKGDDVIAELRNLVNEFRGVSSATVPTQPTVTVSDAPTVTVSLPPQAPVGNTGSGTMDVSTPPFVTLPVEVPHTIVRNFGVTDSSFEKTVNGTRRVIHVPANTSPLLSTLDAAGKEHPYPSVNVNSAYGVQFDISWIAGAWGFTVLEDLVNGTAYKVRLDYTAQVTGDKLDNLAEWLYHELDINGKVTGVSQGISNGVSYAEWGITGGHLPIMITPRIRCLWASASDNSVISWQRLTITPVDYGAAG